MQVAKKSRADEDAPVVERRKSLLDRKEIKGLSIRARYRILQIFLIEQVEVARFFGCVGATNGILFKDIRQGFLGGMHNVGARKLLLF